MESYSTLRLLGEGAHGRVFLAREKRTSQPHKRLVCIKQLFASSSSSSAAQNEIALMKRVRHPNVVRFIDAFALRRGSGSGSGSGWCIVMEFCSGGDLRAFLKSSSPPPRRRLQIHEDRVWYWAVQLSLALAFLHRRGIWHRDVKTSNVFLSDAGFLVLGDLGIARARSSPLDLASTAVGTPLYMAPEIWDSKPYDESCDLYALGCVLYEVCMGNTPFEGARSTPELIRRVCATGSATSVRYAPLPSNKWSSRLRGLVDALLSVDATQRPRAHAILTDPANAIHVKRYVQDRARVALRGGGGGGSSGGEENEEQAILHEQLTALGVAVEGVVVETPPPPPPLPMETRVQQQAPVHLSGQAVQHVEREQLLWLQRERERHEQLRVALQRVQELQLKQQQQLAQVQVHPQPDPISSNYSRHGVGIAALETSDAEWKAPVQTKPSSSSQRPSSAGGSSSSSSSSSTAFTGIPRHQGVALTPQASKFAQKTQSPLCRDVRVLRKHECAKAAARYKATLDTQFNTVGKTKPAATKPLPTQHKAAAKHAENSNDAADSDVAEAIAQLEAALRAQLAADYHSGPITIGLTKMAQTKKPVELHSHDFEWEELARQCEQEDALQDADADAHDSMSDADAGINSIDAHELGDVAKTKWDEFHQRNHGKAYKPRNYLTKEFPELLSDSPLRVLEVGCGYGSAIFPILQECPHVTADVCDFSASAIDILKQNPQFDASRCHAFVCDITTEPLGLPMHSVDVVLMVFVLSALPPATFHATLRKIAHVLKPGGVVLFRDYGLYDLAMRRNAKRLAPSLYYRSDGTLAFFFSREEIEKLFYKELGFEVLENEYCTVRLVNRKKRVTMDRVWLHAKCRKPLVAVGPSENTESIEENT